jgi:hypothetical protein
MVNLPDQWKSLIDRDQFATVTLLGGLLKDEIFTVQLDEVNELVVLQPWHQRGRSEQRTTPSANEHKLVARSARQTGLGE